MADKVSKESRSQIMSAIRSKNNKSTELKMVNILRREKISGWRRHIKIIGSPDFLWRKERLALFIDGCFWHGCKKCYKEPKSNVDFWKAKILRNVTRDKKTNKALRGQEWRVLRVWECQLKTGASEARVIKKLKSELDMNFRQRETPTSSKRPQS